MSPIHTSGPLSAQERLLIAKLRATQAFYGIRGIGFEVKVLFEDGNWNDVPYQIPSEDKCPLFTQADR